VTWEDEVDELDRQYYLGKIDELCRCLPVVRAAKRAKRTLKECVRITAGGSDEGLDSLVKAIEDWEREEAKHDRP